MNILFLTLLDFSSLSEHNIYTDLLREFAKHNHKVYIISPIERRKKQESQLIETDEVVILKLKIGNIQKTNILEKGFSTLSIEPLFIAGIKKYFSQVKFDLVIYSTPPITFCNAIQFVKKRDGARTYLLLKDIFPQNAMDIGILTERGVKRWIYKFFRAKEKKLYSISDRIGCMSPANVEYVLRYNPEVNPDIVEVCPNSVEPIDLSLNEETRTLIRNKYRIPLNKKVFVYGGNLGKPQGIDFLIECLQSQETNEKAYFLIVGDGTEYGKLEAYKNSNQPKNVRLMKRLPKEDYDVIVAACDVGMIFLDHRFTIPNFPSRLLNYMQAKLPVLICSDGNTDIGRIAEENGFGYWCESNGVSGFQDILNRFIEMKDLDVLGTHAFLYLNTHYSASITYEIISKSIISE